MIQAPPRETGDTTLEAPAAQSASRSGNSTLNRKPARRLPAFGRRLRVALDAGYRPRLGGGIIVVTTEWYYARSFDPGRVVCPPGEPVAEFDFNFLRGCDVVVLVPEADEMRGEQLVTAIRVAGASLALLYVNRDAES